MRTYPDFTGMVFKHLTVIRQFKTRETKILPRWECKCVCGKEQIIVHSHLERGIKTSCGCVSRTQADLNKMRRGLDGNLAYHRWCTMKSRVKNDPNYRHIKIADRWYSFENFFSDMNYPPSRSHTLERVNNSKGYEPGNCIWATAKAQARNKRTTLRIKYQGSTQLLIEWCEKLNLKYSAVYWRYKKGKSAEEILKLLSVER